MKKKFKWEKWVDPLHSNIEEVEWPGFNQDDDGNEIPVMKPAKYKVMHTKMGILTMMDHTIASSHFDFWIMHTNFDITNSIVELIRTVPGVETLEIYTRYRARIGFPTSDFFKPRDVMHAIEEAVLGIDRTKQNQVLYGIQPDVIQKVMDVRDELDKKHDHWAILLLPNGSMEVVTSNRIDDSYREQLNILSATNQAVGGRMISSEV